MATKIVTKNSSTASAVPTASDLVQGELAVNVADKRLFTEDNGGSIVELGTNPSTLTVTGEITANGGIALGDSDIATFGASDDLQIYHNGSHSFIKDVGTGNLYIDATSLYVRSATGEPYIVGTADAGVSIYHNNAIKLATTSTGIDVTGTATMDGLTVDTSSVGGFKVTNEATSGVRLTTYQGTTNSNVRAAYVDSQEFVVSTGAPTGTTVTERMRIDSSGNVGIGVVPEAWTYFSPIQAKRSSFAGSDGQTGVGYNWYYDGAYKYIANDYALAYQQNSSSGVHSWSTAASGTADASISWSERMRIASNGAVLVGKQSGTAGNTIETNGRISAAAGSNGQPTFNCEGDTNTGINLPESDRIQLITGGTERMRIDSSGNLLVGKTATDNTTAGTRIHPAGYASFTIANDYPIIANRLSSDGDIAVFRKDGTTVGSIGYGGGGILYNAASNYGLKFYDAGSSNIIHPATTAGGDLDGSVDLGYAGARFKDLYLSGGVTSTGFGSQLATTSFVQNAITTTVGSSSGAFIRMAVSNAGNPTYAFDGDTDTGMFTSGSNTLNFSTASTERMRIDSSGNLLVGTTDASPWNNSANSTADNGFAVSSVGTTGIARYQAEALNLNRTGNDGSILDFQKSGSTVGSIGATSGSLGIGQSNTGLGFFNTDSIIFPATAAGATRDNAIDLGYSGARFDDIYATNGTIQTSDRNEKQDIAELSDAEQRVAVAAKGLLRKFRWKDSVAEKGDEARTHFGIIAQDLQAAFEAEGLDAGDYAMFTSTTWTDEETNEEKTRMGVRYSELLAFIISAI